MMDATAHVLMDPRVALGYAAWWVGVRPGDIRMSEDDSSDEVDSNERLKEDDPYQVNNMIHLKR